MSLQTKFAILLGLVAVTVGAILSITLWTSPQKRGSSEFVEAARGLETTIFLGRNVRTARHIAIDARGRLPDGGPPDIERELEAMRDALGLHEDDPLDTIRVRELNRLVDEAAEHAATDPPTDASIGALVTTLDAINDRIEKTQDYVLNNTDLARAHSARLLAHQRSILAITASVSLLVGLLGLSLLRRWVLRPIASVREATARISKGDYGYRIAYEGNDELGQLSTEVNHMASTIQSMQDERVEREKLAAVGEVVRRLAHNLRNPLAAIRGLAELTMGDLPEEGSARGNQRRIMTAVDRFERWLSELLEATSPLTMDPQSLELQPWLEDVVEAHRVEAELKKVRLAMVAETAPAQVMVDRRHLEQAIVAMLSNAIEATPAGGCVDIVATGVGERWELRISDEGTGVPEALRTKIFTPYFTTKPGGNGIGLAVAHQVVTAHGGTISVQSNGGPEGGGATFVVDLPLAQS